MENKQSITLSAEEITSIMNNLSSLKLFIKDEYSSIADFAINNIKNIICPTTTLEVVKALEVVAEPEKVCAVEINKKVEKKVQKEKRKLWTEIPEQDAIFAKGSLTKMTPVEDISVTTSENTEGGEVLNLRLSYSKFTAVVIASVCLKNPNLVYHNINIEPIGESSGIKPVNIIFTGSFKKDSKMDYAITVPRGRSKVTFINLKRGFGEFGNFIGTLNGDVDKIKGEFKSLLDGISNVCIAIAKDKFNYATVRPGRVSHTASESSPAASIE